MEQQHITRSSKWSTNNAYHRHRVITMKILRRNEHRTAACTKPDVDFGVVSAKCHHPRCKALTSSTFRIAPIASALPNTRPYPKLTRKKTCLTFEVGWQNTWTEQSTQKLQAVHRNAAGEYIYIYIDTPWYTLLYCFKLPHVSLQMWNHQYPPSKLETIAAPDHFFGSGLASSRNFWSASMPGRHHKRCQFALSECHLVKQIGLSCFVQAKDYSLELHCLPQPLNNENGPQSCWVSRNWPLKFSHFSRVNLLGFSPSMVTVRIRHDGAMTDAV